MQYLEYTVSIQRVPSATKRRLLPVRHDSGTYAATGTSLLGRAASIYLPLHFEHPHPVGAPTLQRQSTWASTGGPARPNRTGLFEDRGRSAARSLFTNCFRDWYQPFRRRFFISLFASHPPIPSKTLDLGYICSDCMLLHMSIVHMYCVAVVRMGGSTASLNLERLLSIAYAVRTTFYK